MKLYTVIFRYHQWERIASEPSTTTPVLSLEPNNPATPTEEITPLPTQPDITPELVVRYYTSADSLSTKGRKISTANHVHLPEGICTKAKV